jgi:hypothetical protein
MTSSTVHVEAYAAYHSVSPSALNCAFRYRVSQERKSPGSFENRFSTKPLGIESHDGSYQ